MTLIKASAILKKQQEIGNQAKVHPQNALARLPAMWFGVSLRHIQGVMLLYTDCGWARARKMRGLAEAFPGGARHFVPATRPTGLLWIRWLAHLVAFSPS